MNLAYYIFDRAYVDYLQVLSNHKTTAYFVVRQIKFKIQKNKNGYLLELFMINRKIRLLYQKIILKRLESSFFDENKIK
jgi:hypothetical protein